MTDLERNLLDDHDGGGGDDAIRRALSRVRTIAVVGFKSDPGAAAFGIPQYLHRHGYRVIAVSPKVAGSTQLGLPAVASLADIREPVDLVDVFRAPANLPAHAEEALALQPLPAVFWMQLGIRHDAAALRLARGGILVVQDRCLMVEHRRLLG